VRDYRGYQQVIVDAETMEAKEAFESRKNVSFGRFCFSGEKTDPILNFKYKKMPPWHKK